MSNRRVALATVTALLCAAAAAATIDPVPTFASESRPAEVSAVEKNRSPNILFILIDDMGFGDLSVMGDKKVSTPNLDKLAHDGVLMTRFYDAAPICSASRAGFLTGRFPAEAGFVTYLDSRASNAELGQADWLDPKLPTIARLLQNAGYATAHFGKWHVGGGRDVTDAPWPKAYGFDQSLTTWEGLGPRVLVADEGDDVYKLPNSIGPHFYELKRNLTQLYCNLTTAFVMQHTDRPWFVNLWFNDVHDPWLPGDDAMEAVLGRGSDNNDRRYLATLVKMDATIGRMMRQLDEMGQLDNTLVIVTSDNGPTSRAEYYKDGHGAPGSVQALRGRKWSNYEGGIRQPMILYWRGHMKPGTRDDVTVGEGVDLMTTLAAITGQAAPKGSEGIDLSPVLMGKPIKSRPPLFWAYGAEGAAKQPPQPALPHDDAPPFAVRDGDWKLLAGPGGSSPELYNVATDPNESHDVAASQPAIRDRLLKMLKTWMAKLPRYGSGGATPR